MADDISSHSNDKLSRRGLLFVLSSPSGAGKSTLARMLLGADDEIAMSVSVTTRAQRPGEEHGKDYYFVTGDEFEEMVADHAFLEYATVFGHRYATPAAPVQKSLEHGQDVLFDIDWQGTQQLYQRAGQDVVRVFILPPTLAELRDRLESRATDSNEIIDSRMQRATSEISHWDGYDYVLINDDLDACFAKVKQILSTERLRRARQTGLIGFVRDLVAE
ncbi:guanylate kinase [Parasphingorhabdus halotolerans]|uniref:Guanylate kinase n=1 Tax=Parasphingorhabdus halotolerans TaxID=2725558 RepID=A0A6H2DJI8_9SPHN|nr:guanylate kinase [Parasphingorhabdus halotolerans]QJB68842.1 guanylate kinase [Parasphingorhabdus halotolerans]